jgi:hypothetical protein
LQPQFLSSGLFAERQVLVMDLPLNAPSGNGGFVPRDAGDRPAAPDQLKTFSVVDVSVGFS